MEVRDELSAQMHFRAKIIFYFPREGGFLYPDAPIGGRPALKHPQHANGGTDSSWSSAREIIYMAKVKSLVAGVAAVIMAAQAAASDVPTLGTTKTEVSAFLGLTWTFGSAHAPRTPGVSLKVLSTNKRDAAALAAGVTYNFDNTWGCDIGLAYNFPDTTMTGSWDICKRAPQIGVGGTKRPEITPVQFVN